MKLESLLEVCSSYFLLVNETVFCHAIILTVLGIHLTCCAASTQIAEDYSHCQFLIRLPGYCPSIFSKQLLFSPSCYFFFFVAIYNIGSIFIIHYFFLFVIFACMRLAYAVPAFRDVVDVPLVVRRLHKTRQEVSHSIELLYSIIFVSSVILLLKFLF